MSMFYNSKLTVDQLKMSDCGINLIGFINLLKSLYVNPILKMLNMSHNHFSHYETKTFEQFKDYITTFMYSNKALVHLDISNCAMDKKATRFIYNSFLMRQNMMFIHTDHNNDLMFDNMNTINPHWITKSRIRNKTE